MQECLENYLFVEYDQNQATIEEAINRMRSSNIGHLPGEYQDRMSESIQLAANTFDLVDDIRSAESSLETYSPGYRPLHQQVRQIQKSIRRLGAEIDELEQQRQRIVFSGNVDQDRIDELLVQMAALEAEQKVLGDSIPDTWEAARAEFTALAKAETTARRKYRQNSDDSYAFIVTLQTMISQTEKLQGLEQPLTELTNLVQTKTAKEGLDAVDALADEIDLLAEMHRVTSKLSRAKRALRGNSPDKDKALAQIQLAQEAMQSEIAWRLRSDSLASDLGEYDQAIANTIGMRMQQRLTTTQAESIASCLAVHRDLSLHF